MSYCNYQHELEAMDCATEYLYVLRLIDHINHIAIYRLVDDFAAGSKPVAGALER